MALIGSSPAWREAVRKVDKAARTPASVLVVGPNGAGKEGLAKRVHERSDRKGAFVAVNCGAIPEHMVEHTLFGHIKGAYTGAVTDGPGLVRESHGGTLFLDEIGELPLEHQVKLLRVLQEREVRPVGATKTVPVDLRVVAATNKDLWAEVQAGRFREDLFHRLRVVVVVVPSLHDRGPGDIDAFAAEFLATARTDGYGTARKLAPDAITALRQRDWTGNVRELKHAIERGLVNAEGDAVTAADLELDIAMGAPPATAKVAVAGSAEGTDYVAALAEHGSERKAAAALGIARSTFKDGLREQRSDHPPTTRRPPASAASARIC